MTDTDELTAGETAPKNTEEVSDYLARVTAELTERKAASDEAAQRLAGVAQAAQAEIDEVTRQALVERREVERRRAAEIADTQTRLMQQVDSAGQEREAAAKSYASAIDAVVASGLITRALLSSMGFAAPRGKTKPKRVSSKIKPRDVD
ncbi:MAG: hypothetical protein WBP82_09450 [Leuconostoc mesenteroides]